MSRFFTIPDDLILEEVLCRLPLVDLISCLSTCHQLHELITSSKHLIYLTELEVAGMVDNPHCSYVQYPYSKRLKMLRDREMRWERLDFQWRKNIQLPAGVMNDCVTQSEGHLLLLPLSDDIDQITDMHSSPLPDDSVTKVQWNKINLGKHICRAGTALYEHDLLVCCTM
jgi:hypothetical protein